MPIMVRVDKCKNLQNIFCLPSLLCHLMCPWFFGGDFLIFSLWNSVHSKKINEKNEKNDYYFSSSEQNPKAKK